MILIFSSKTDEHIGGVTNCLESRGATWIRINTEDFATNVDLSIDPTTGSGTLQVRDSGRSIDLAKVKAVWYRKPEPPNLQHFELEQAEFDYVEAEFNEVLRGLYALLRDALWINDPFRTRLSHRKFLQLKAAKQVGFAVPKTLVTNNVADAMAFASSTNCDLAIKSLGSVSVTRTCDGGKVREYGLFTRRITLADLEALQDKISHMPTVFQEYIDKSWDLRVTCVGTHVFGCKIDSQTSAAAVEDFRLDTWRLPHELVDCDAILRPLQAYLEYFKLNFGCFDLGFSEERGFVFFECNPNGQWLWIEKLTGAPISRAIADLLFSSEG